MPATTPPDVLTPVSPAVRARRMAQDAVDAAARGRRARGRANDGLEAVRLQQQERVLRAEAHLTLSRELLRDTAGTRSALAPVRAATRP